MNPHPTDRTHGRPVSGCVFYDAQCRLCQRTLRWIGPALHARGFDFVPIQSPLAAERLRLPAGELPHEMKLLCPDGVVLGGTDAWVRIARRVWWMLPVWCLSFVPGGLPAMRASYRWIARNRHCLGGACTLGNHASHHRHQAFLELP